MCVIRATYALFQVFWHRYISSTNISPVVNLNALYHTWCVSLMCCRWLAPLLLLLDLYEKFASVSKIKAVLETHVVMLLWIFFIINTRPAILSH